MACLFTLAFPDPGVLFCTTMSTDSTDAQAAFTEGMPSYWQHQREEAASITKSLATAQQACNEARRAAASLRATVNSQTIQGTASRWASSVTVDTEGATLCLLRCAEALEKLCESQEVDSRLYQPEAPGRPGDTELSSTLPSGGAQRDEAQSSCSGMQGRVRYLAVNRVPRMAVSSVMENTFGAGTNLPCASVSRTDNSPQPASTQAAEHEGIRTLIPTEEWVRIQRRVERRCVQEYRKALADHFSRHPLCPEGGDSVGAGEED